MTVDRPGTIDHRHDEVDPGAQGLVIAAEPLDDHRLGLLDDANAFRDQDDDPEGDGGDEYRAWTHGSNLLFDQQSCAVHLDDRLGRARLDYRHVPGRTEPVLGRNFP